MANHPNFSQSTSSNKVSKTRKQKTLTIIGAGAWGSALATLASRNGHLVRLWSRRSPEKIEEVVAQTDVVLSAVSMKGVRPVIERLQGIEFPESATLLSVTKGLDPATTNTPSQIWQEFFPYHPVVVLSGPNLSQEILAGLPAATVVASSDESAAFSVQEIFSSNTFRVYVNSDPLGTELGGALKNIMAIASGVCDGLNLGTNAKAALLTRALPEIIRVGTRLGASTETFFGLSGLGDLLVTCNSPLSRNYQVGYGLSEGKLLEEILASLKGTAEGVYTVKVLIDIANREDLAVPISCEVYRLLSGQTTPQEAVEALMERDPKPEFGGLF